MFKIPILKRSDWLRIERYTGKVVSVSLSPGGLVHRVYKITGERRSVYLKWRGSRFFKIPQIKTNPAHIRDEVMALKFFGSRFPGVFPKVLIFDRKRHFVLLSDVMSGGRVFEEKLNRDEAKKADFYLLGKMLGSIHTAISQVTDHIRLQGDKEFRDKQLFYLLGFSNHPALNLAVEQYKKMPTNLILGDPSPKNVYIEEGRIGICDLENSHQGWHGFERAHMVSHIILHNLSSSEAATYVSESLRGYKETGPPFNVRSKLFIRTVLGLIFYRLASPVIPYNIAIAERRKKALSALIDKLLCDERTTLGRLLAVLQRGSV